MPEATVAAIITSQKNGETKVLLTRRTIEPFKGQWCGSGGHIEPQEPAKAAILRKVKEETGLDSDARFFGYLNEIVKERAIHAVVLVFEGLGTGTLSPAEDEVSDVNWFSVREAQVLTLAFTHSDILDAYADRYRPLG